VVRASDTLRWSAPGRSELSRRGAHRAVGPSCGPLRSFQPLRFKCWVGVDAHEVRLSGAVVGELVRRVGWDDHDVAGVRIDSFLTGLEGEVPLDDDPGLVVGVLVQPRPLAGLGVVEDQRDGGSVVGALEVAGGEGAGIDHWH